MKRYLTLICLCMFMAFGLCGCSSAASSAEAALPDQPPVVVYGMKMPQKVFHPAPHFSGN